MFSNMKKFHLVAMALLLCTTVIAQKPLSGERKFQILVNNTNSYEAVMNNNQKLAMMQAENTDDSRGLLTALLKTGYNTLFVQKTVNASSNLMELGLSYLIDAVKGDREKWYRKAKQQCTFSQVLKNETTIDDFYALPSTKGALDPQNLKFEGFGCRNYIEVSGQPGMGRDVFMVFCKLRQDDEGLRHIVNHSKFYVELDTLMFDPYFCNLPNDSTGSIDSRFDFKKRKDLVFTLKVRLFSSWMNEAIMVTDNQQLGEFIIQARIDPQKLNDQGVFIYDKNDPECQKLVTVSGESFIVPRSFTGTKDFKNYQPTWGTGQYRVEMEVLETCNIVDEYYQIPIPQVGNAEAVVFGDEVLGKRKWDKMKWLPEWKAMRSRVHGTPIYHNIWKSIETAYAGDNWITTLTSPLVTALTSYELQKLNQWFNLPIQQQGQQGQQTRQGQMGPNGHIQGR